LGKNDAAGRVNNASVASDTKRSGSTTAGLARSGSSDTHVPHDRAGLSVILGLCLVGFFVNCQPSEPFLSRFLIEDKGLSEEELDNQVWPYDTYGSFLFLVPVGLLAESYGYRRVVFIGLLCREATRVLLLFANGVGLMAVVQLTYAAATSANTVYYAYAYMVVSEEDFHVATGFMRASYHSGNVLGAILGQLLVDNGVELRTLFYLSWGFTTLGLICFVLFLPAPSRAPPPSLASLLLHPQTNQAQTNQDGEMADEDTATDSKNRISGTSSSCSCSSSGWKALFGELRRLYTGQRLIQWSVWWFVMYGVNQMISNYFQNQLYDVDENAKFGYAEAAMEAFAVIGALTAMKSPESLAKNLTGALIFAGSAATGVSYLLATVLSNAGDVIGVASLNVIPVGIYGFMITVASATIAAEALTPRYAVIFTVNTFVSLGIATIVQQAAAATSTTTNGYYIIATVMTFVLALYAILSSVYYRVSRKENAVLGRAQGEGLGNCSGPNSGAAKPRRYCELEEPDNVRNGVPESLSTVEGKGMSTANKSLPGIA